MLTPSPYAWVSQYFIGFFFAYGVYLPFWSLWFEKQGISPADIGLLVGLGLATRCVANLTLTPRLHRVENLLPALRYLSLLALLFVGCHFLVGSNFWLMALVTILFNSCCGPIVPVSDAVVNYYARLKMLDYGQTRLWGSIAFILGSTAVGYLITAYGSDVILYTAIFGLFISFVLAMRYVNPMPMTKSQYSQERPRLSVLLSDRATVKFLCLVALIQGSHAAYYGFSAIYWQASGISAEMIGYLWSLGVAAEIAIFALSKRLFAGWSIRSLFIMAAFGVILRWGMTAMSTAMWVLVLVQLLHGITFAVAHIAAIQYIQHAAENKVVVLQALYNAIPLGGFIALMTILSGRLYEVWGGNVFWLMAAMGALALMIKLEPQRKGDSIIDLSKPSQGADNPTSVTGIKD
ncbi:3-phenylpropionate MFS transporter [Vibrio sagamiensis]|uniref:3-phenylpropionic acid transporter n=1 Tax=Vibrio sagamiensis NBRC 104589 TaxID=1219064 RepID=A0A511QH46_9VIBR|nr:3-phenylpropionate MFS transporter [Vibrio sagamiensis]PNQ71486.1 3-phenylpropionate MFS transporter [Vibrio agarivorans]GEM76635.1 3-phenylpropionic acid transporter [Vibrio sagamiensis NBRC 104589]